MKITSVIIITTDALVPVGTYWHTHSYENATIMSVLYPLIES